MFCHNLQDAVYEAMKIAGSVLPPVYTTQITGSSKSSWETFNSLIFTLVIGIITSYMIPGSQFNITGEGQLTCPGHPNCPGE